jgi:acetyl-CoA carboxylase biotin carboxyl carrier protein
MELKDIRELVKLIDKSTVNEIEIENEAYKIRIARNTEVQVVNQSVAQPVMPAMPAPSATGTPAPAATPAAEEAAVNYIEVKSPMVGTFYSSPSPESDAFVKVGDTINDGQTLCIIEAMKLMNEFKSEVSGKIVKILVNNADPVEYNQVLFHIAK